MAALSARHFLPYGFIAVVYVHPCQYSICVSLARGTEAQGPAEISKENAKRVDPFIGTAKTQMQENERSGLLLCFNRYSAVEKGDLAI